MALVEVQEQHGIARVRMNRPDVRNSFNPQMIEELTGAFASLDRKNVRAIAFTGEGKVFSAGADLAWMKAMVNYSFEENRQDSLRLHDMFETIARCAVPIVGMAQGAAFGGALGLLACCDFVIAEEDAQFCFSEVKLGLAPAVISGFVLAKTVPGVVRPLMISGKVFDGETALRAGLVHRIVPKGTGLQALEEELGVWGEAGPEASRETKRLLNDLPSLGREALRDRSSKLIAERRVSTEGQEGLKSFLDKRSPAWRIREED